MLDGTCRWGAARGVWSLLRRVLPGTGDLGILSMITNGLSRAAPFPADRASAGDVPGNGFVGAGAGTRTVVPAPAAPLQPRRLLCRVVPNAIQGALGAPRILQGETTQPVERLPPAARFQPRLALTAGGQVRKARDPQLRRPRAATPPGHEAAWGLLRPEAAVGFQPWGREIARAQLCYQQIMLAFSSSAHC